MPSPSVSPGALTAIQAGPLRVTYACPQGVTTSVQQGSVTLVATCALSLTNVSNQTQYVIIQSSPIQARTGLPTFTEQSVLTFYPGQTTTVPVPPTGQQWVVTAVSRRSVQHTMASLGDALVLVGGLAVYGAYEAFKQRKTLWHHIRRFL